jgi:hypothetical protein
MKNNKECAYCESKLTESSNSKEHIIPNSIGGQKKVRGFICKECNNELGQTCDTVLAEQLNYFSLAVGIKRDRGFKPNKNMNIQTEDGTELRLQSSGVMTRKEPFFEKDESGNFRMFARTEKEARDMLKGVKRKHPEFNLEKELNEIKITAFKVDSKVLHRLELGGKEAGRSIVKTAIAQCLVADIESYRCEIGIQILKNPTYDKGFFLFYTHDLVIDRPKNILFHLVAVRGDLENSTLIAYVEYFGAMRMMVKLSNEYKGNSFTSVYAINPQTGEELDLSVNWDIPLDELEASFNSNKLSHTELSHQNFNNAYQNAVSIASNVRIMRERQYAYRDALSTALSQLGLEKGSIPDPKDKHKFNSIMTEILGSHPNYLNNIPPMPTPKK